MNSDFCHRALTACFIALVATGGAIAQTQPAATNSLREILGPSNDSLNHLITPYEPTPVARDQELRVMKERVERLEERLDQLNRSRAPAMPAYPALHSSPTLLMSLPVRPGDQAKSEEDKVNGTKTETARPADEDSAATDKGDTFEKLLNLKPTFQLRGRIEVDAWTAAQSAASKAAIGELENGYGFRRIRLGAQGTIGDSTSWVSELEFAGGNVNLADVFVELDALPGVRQLRVGFFREPYSLEDITSSNFITFLERSPLTVISPDRNWGVCGFWWPDDKRFLFSAGAFRDQTPGDGESIGNSNNWACTTRLTGLPVYESAGTDFNLVHVGGAFSERRPPNGILELNPTAVSTILSVEDNPGSPFLPRFAIPTNSYQLYNLQAACVLGQFSLQGEWCAAVIQQTDAGLIFVDGVYVFGSYFLTGEHRGYNLTRGSFDQVDVLRPLIRSRTDPRGGFGAVELTARFSYLDLKSSNLPLDTNGVPGNTILYEMTVGVNWYLNSYTRVMFDYTAAVPDKVGSSPSVVNTFGVRTAIYW